MIEPETETEDNLASVVEVNQRLSQSRLWQIQRQFFDQQGIQAWSTGKVPHYVTSNPYIARAYANVVVGFLRDCLANGTPNVKENPSRLERTQISEAHSATLDSSQPVYIVELGTGHGRFSYHFLKQFFAYYPQSPLGQISVKYVMTDFAQSTVDFWQSHPFLQDYIQQGILDFACFDFETDNSLKLIHSSEVLSAETLKNPLIVFANYFFDSIPQDLFTLQDRQLYESLVTLTASAGFEALPPLNQLETLQIDFKDQPISTNYYEDPALNQVLQSYQQHLDNTSLLFPISALAGLTRLRQIARDRLLLLSTDKGYSCEADLHDRPKPELVFHGSFSLSVNYHAIAEYVQTQGGQAFVPTHQPGSIQVCAFLLGLSAQGHLETQQAYQQFIQDAGPDDFFTLKKSLDPHYHSLNLQQILSYLRFSGWDSNIFLSCFPTLRWQIKVTPEQLYPEVIQAIHHIWDTYYWIGEDTDLPFRLSVLLAEMEQYQEAIDFANYSLQLHGETLEVLLHQATCHLRLGQTSEALARLEQTLTLAPQMEVAQALKQAVVTGNDEIDTLVDLVLSQAGSSGSMSYSASLDPLSLSFLSLRQALESYIEGNSTSFLSTTPRTEPSTLSQLGNKFQLSPCERMILLLCLGLEIEPNFQRLCAKAHRDSHKPYATLGLALSALPDADWSVLSPQSPLHYWQLIHLEPGHLLTESPITLDRRILCYLLDEPAVDSHLADLVSPLPPNELADALPPSYQGVVQQLIATWSATAPHQPLPLISLTGANATANQTVAVTACDRLGFQLMSLPIAVLPTEPHDLKQLQRRWEREAILSNSVLLLDGDTELSGELSRQTVIALFLETLTTPVIFSSRDISLRLRRPVIALEVPTPSHNEQTVLWRTHLGEVATALNGQIDVLANQFKLTPTAIQTVCQQFKIQTSDLSVEDKPEAKNRKPTSAAIQSSIQKHLWSLCRQQARPSLDDFAQRINPAATWKDLILPSRQRQVLEDIAAHLKYRAQVYQTWGFAQKGDRGLGISVLFQGDSGTGKTMAAEVLAQECNLDLYRIDLSTVVSKYIGETEKNLRRIFDAAEAGSVILLFDEADALFGKRTEVKDSHDRHANIEVSYLLQRMESYQGLAILTSNLKNNLDEAFLRRLRFIVPFPFPDAQARAEIWQRIFPAQTPIQGLDYDKLGQLKVSGGNIRNIALNAAFLAAQVNQPVTMHYIHQAAQRDYLKLDKLLTTEELKGWNPRN